MLRLVGFLFFFLGNFFLFLSSLGFLLVLDFSSLLLFEFFGSSLLFFLDVFLALVGVEGLAKVVKVSVIKLGGLNVHILLISLLDFRFVSLFFLGVSIESSLVGSNDGSGIWDSFGSWLSNLRS